MEKSLFQLTKHDLGTANFAMADDARPMLCNVLVRINKDKQIELIATDSYMLIIHKPQEVVDKGFEQFLIPAKTLQLAHKLMSAKNIECYVFEQYLSLPQLKIRLDFSPEGESEAAKYPDIDKLLAGVSDNHLSKINLNAKYVSKMCTFLGNGPITETVEIEINDKLEPVIFKTSQTYGVVMPLRS